MGEDWSLIGQQDIREASGSFQWSDMYMDTIDISLNKIRISVETCAFIHCKAHPNLQGTTSDFHDVHRRGSPPPAAAWMAYVGILNLACTGRMGNPSGRVVDTNCVQVGAHFWDDILWHKQTHGICVIVHGRKWSAGVGAAARYLVFRISFYRPLTFNRLFTVIAIGHC